MTHTHRHLGPKCVLHLRIRWTVAIPVAKPHRHINRNKAEATQSCNILSSSSNTPGLFSSIFSFARSALVRLPELKSANSLRRITRQRACLSYLNMAQTGPPQEQFLQYHYQPQQLQQVSPQSPTGPPNDASCMGLWKAKLSLRISSLLGCIVIIGLCIQIAIDWSMIPIYLSAPPVRLLAFLNLALLSNFPPLRRELLRSGTL
jgi:hypothetical protein